MLEMVAFTDATTGDEVISAFATEAEGKTGASERTLIIGVKRR